MSLAPIEAVSFFEKKDIADSGRKRPEYIKRCAPISKKEKPPQLRSGLVRIYNVAVLFFE